MENKGFLDKPDFMQNTEEKQEISSEKPLISSGIKFIDLLDTSVKDTFILPSKGHWYADLGEEYANGLVTVRAMTTQEQKKLLGGGKPEAKFEMWLNSCVKFPSGNSINFNKLISSDIQFLLIVIRAMGISVNYPVKVRCEECSYKEDYQINLIKDLQVHFIPENFTATEPFSFELPYKKDTIEYRLPRRADEKEIERYKKRELKSRYYKPEQGDPTFDYSYALRIKTINGEEVDLREKLEQFAKWTNKDQIALQHDHAQYESGIDPVISLNCKNCGEDIIGELKLTKEFLHPRSEFGRYSTNT